ncbi:class I SAM-dependent methyltransferase [Desulfovibrio sp. OttesenSCG-928-F20]|nr:class I SAM-dependent methyltransferase [Desulfovibrio sp. OttesenSCG-928-F20]
MPRKQVSNASDLFSADQVLPRLADLGRMAATATLKGLAMRGLLPQTALVDCTCGNGQDSLFLLRALSLLEEGEQCRVLALDVQQAALDSAALRLKRACVAGASLVCDSHENLEKALACHAPGRSLGLALYNLGFLPGGDRQIITRPASTLASLEAAARLLLPGGLVWVHAYAGHQGGAEERAVVEEWFRALPEKTWQATSYCFCNKTRNPESLFLAHKIQAG